MRPTFLDQHASRRRLLGFTGAAGLAVLGLATGCTTSPSAQPTGRSSVTPVSSSGQTTKVPAAQGSSDSQATKLTVIELQSTPTTLNAWKEVRTKFAAKHPGVTFDVQTVPWANMMEKAATAVGGGAPLDVSQWWDDQRVPELASKGFLVALDPYISADKYDLTDFFDQALLSNQLDSAIWNLPNPGKQWGLPYYWDVRPFFWNKQHFTDAGLDPEKPPTNWNELRELAQKLTKPWPITNTIDRLGFIPLTTQGTGYSLTGNSWLYLYGWMNGGEFTSKDLTKITANDPKIVEALDWAVKWAKDFGGPDRLAAFGQKAGAGGLNPFIAEKVSMMISCSACLTTPMKVQRPELLKSLGVAVPPTPKVKVTWSGVLSNNIFKTAKNRDVCWEFVKFNCEKDSMIYYGKTTGFLPTRKSILGDPVFSAGDEIKLATKVLLPITRVRPPVPASQTLWDELVRATDQAMTGQATPQKALDDATAKVQDEVNKSRK